MKKDFKPKYIEQQHTQDNQSNKPENPKVGTTETLVRRTKIVCRSKESLTDKLRYIRKAMQLNGYPEKLITKIIKRELLSYSKLKSSQNSET